MFAGNQGYQLDGELVKAGLILPLNEYAKAYGWDKSYTPETLQQFEWTDDGKTFGEGTLWGVAQSGQSSGVFANMAKLAAAGIDPASLKTFDDFEAALAKLRKTLPADEPVIALGNKDQFGAIHLWGGIQGAYTPAQDIRDWIFHKDGATFDTAGQPEVAAEAQGVGGQGLPRQGRRVQRAQRLRGGGRVRQGQGAFMIGGNWNAATAKDGLGKDATFFDMPPGQSGKAVAIGSTSIADAHLGEDARTPDLAAAYIDFITGPTAGKALVDTAQVPAATDATAEAERPARQGGQDRLGEARQGRRPDAVPRLVLADDAADDGPDLPGDAGRRGSRRRTSSAAVAEGLGGVPQGARGRASR